jgi:hypothetical protein
MSKNVVANSVISYLLSKTSAANNPFINIPNSRLSI